MGSVCRGCGHGPNARTAYGPRGSTRSVGARGHRPGLRRSARLLYVPRAPRRGRATHHLTGGRGGCRHRGSQVYNRLPVHPPRSVRRAIHPHPPGHAASGCPCPDGLCSGVFGDAGVDDAFVRCTAHPGLGWGSNGPRRGARAVARCVWAGEGLGGLGSGGGVWGPGAACLCSRNRGRTSAVVGAICCVCTAGDVRGCG